MKRLFWILPLLAAAGAAAWYWGFRDSTKTATPAFVTTAVATGDVVQVVTVTGQLNPVVNVQVGSQISGLIRELRADFNSKVTAGEVIARLDDATYRANLMSAEGNLAQSKASLQLARVINARNKELLQNGSISQTVADQSDADLARAEAAVKVSEASVARARIDLERCTIYSPVDGIVTSRAVDVGQTVAASLNAPTIFTIAADLAKMQIIANVAEADIGLVQPGQRVLFTVDAFAGRPFFGSVEQVRNSPRTVDNVVTYDTVISVSNEDLLLKPGMTANVQIVVAEKNGVVRVPNSALRVRLAEGTFNPAPPSEAREERPRRAPEGAPSEGAAPAAGNAAAAAPSGAPAERGPRGDGSFRRNRSGGGEAPSALMRQFRERSGARTLRTAFRLPADAPAGTKPDAVEVRVGITDGQFTEILSGLSEGDVVVTGLVAEQSSSGPQRTPQGGNPFGGGRPQGPFGR